MEALRDEFSGVKLQEKIKEVERLLELLALVPKTKKTKRQIKRATEHLNWLKERQ
jgi:hypothetical protein